MSKANFVPETKEIPMDRIAQISDYHCGPAVVEMLLKFQGIEATQHEIVDAAKIKKSITRYGSRIDRLATSVRKLSPNLRLYYKDHCTLEELSVILEKYRLPIAVEWQGLFGMKINPKSYLPEEINDGHYSIVTKLDFEKQEVTLIDPYKDFVAEDRIFTFDQFRKRWWDTNDFKDGKGQTQTIYDYKLIFIVAPKNSSVVKEMGLKLTNHYPSST